MLAPQRPHAGAEHSAAESDFFHNLFGAGARSREGAGFRMRGEDLHAHIDIALQDAFTGAVREVAVHAPGFDESGRLRTHQHVLNVHIPKGVRAGQHIRLRGQGGPGFGGAAAGDLFLEVRFLPRPGFRVDGADLYQTLPVTPWEAALGAVIDADTPAGRFQVSIPAGSQAGRKLRLKGRGIPSAQPGNLFLVVDVVLPPAVTEAQRAVYQAMAREMPFNPREQKEPQT
jgi:curved DNA-binding protein